MAVTRWIRRTVLIGGAAAAASVLGMSTASAAGFAGDNNHNGSIDYGDTGTAVVCAQQAVQYSGGYVGPSGADGQFGWNTYNGVVAYQNSHGLGADGQVGKNTGRNMTAVIRNYRDIYRRTGETALEAQMSNWLYWCVSPAYQDNAGQQIFY